jgi:hypothetical protein
MRIDFPDGLARQMRTAPRDAIIIKKRSTSPNEMTLPEEHAK